MELQGLQHGRLHAGEVAVVAVFACGVVVLAVECDRLLPCEHLPHDRDVLAGARERSREGLPVPAFDDLWAGNEPIELLERAAELEGGRLFVGLSTMGATLPAALLIAGALRDARGELPSDEQIDALETMDINPIRFLFSPRLGAALISFPFLTAIFDVVGILGGYLTGSLLLGINTGVYFSRVESSVLMEDINGGFIKAFCFAAIVVTICCYQGYTTHTRKEGFGAKGVVSTASTKMAWGTEWGLGTFSKGRLRRAVQSPDSRQVLKNLRPVSSTITIVTRPACGIPAAPTAAACPAAASPLTSETSN